MTTCEHICEQLLDFLYGLLDEDETGQVRTHLAGCPACQAALADAESQQRLFARAAQACRDVKPFAAPDFDAPLAEPAHPAVPVAIPAQPSLPTQPVLDGKQMPRRPSVPRWLRLTSVVLAASVLLAVVSMHSYRDGLNEREHQVAQAKSVLETTEASFTKGQAQFEQQTSQLPAKLAKEVLHLQLSASAQYLANAPTNCVVQTTDLTGQPKKAKVHITATDKARNVVLAEQDVDCKGIEAVQLPAGLASQGAVVLTATAVAEEAGAKVQADLRRAEIAHITHLATNKTAYRIGELLFFRTLTLEAASLKPVAKAIPLQFSLMSLDQKFVKQLPVSETGEGGIAGGEFALTSDLPSGVYLLQVAEQNGTVIRQRRLEIISETTPQFVFDRNQYYEGEKAKVTAMNRMPPGPVANKDVTYRYLNAKAGQAGNTAAQQTRTDSRGQASLPVPGDLDSTRALLEIEVHNGKRSEKVVQAVPVIPSKITVEFFPEGGSFVDGVPARVYYRVNSLQGEPVAPNGKIIFRSSKGVLYESPVGKANGVFSFTPSGSESYAVRVTDPQLEIVHTDPVERLGVQSQGVVLSVPTGVTREGQAVRVNLTNKGDAKRLVVMITCRGQIVAHEAAELGNGRAELSLKLPAEAAGVLRVTVYQAQAGGLTPVAERLIYRVPAQCLNLAAATAEGKLGNVRRGATARLSIKGVDEKQAPTDFWALAYVVDAKVKTDKERGLPVHFYFVGDVPDDDLEQAQILLRDTQESQQALDVFLGSQNSPAFRADPSPAPLVVQSAPTSQEPRGKLEALAKADAKDGLNSQNAQGAPAAQESLREKDARRGAASTQLVLLSVENASLAKLQANYEQRLAQSLGEKQAALNALRHDLKNQREAQAALVGRLLSDLAEYRELPRRWLGQVAGITLLFCLVTGVIMVLYGVVNVLRRRQATFAFAGSFAALACCMVLYLTARHMNGEQADDILSANLNPRPWPATPRVEVAHAAKAPVTAGEAPMLPPGTYTVAQESRQIERQTLKEAEKQELMSLAMTTKSLNDAVAAKLQENAAAMTNQLDGGGFGGASQQPNARFAQAKNNQESLAKQQSAGSFPVPMSPSAPPAAPASGTTPPNYSNLGQPKKGAEASQEAKKALQQDETKGSRNEPYVWSKQQDMDTILWVPALIGANGAAQLSFDLPNLPASYRVIIHGHTANGRLGFFEGVLEAK